MARRTRTRMPWPRGRSAADASFFEDAPQRWPRRDSPEVSVFSPAEEAESHRRWNREILRERFRGPVSGAEALGLGISAASLAALADLDGQPHRRRGEAGGDAWPGDGRATAAGDAPAMRKATAAHDPLKPIVTSKAPGSTNAFLDMGMDTGSFSSPLSGRADPAAAARRAAPRGGGAPLETRPAGTERAEVVVLRKPEQAATDARAPLVNDGAAAVRGAAVGEASVAAAAFVARPETLVETRIEDRDQAAVKGAKADQGRGTVEARAPEAAANETPPAADAGNHARPDRIEAPVGRENAAAAAPVMETKAAANNKREATAAEVSDRTKARDVVADEKAAVAEVCEAPESAVEAKAKDVGPAVESGSGTTHKAAKPLVETKTKADAGQGTTDVHAPAQVKDAPAAVSTKADIARDHADAIEQAATKTAPATSGAAAAALDQGPAHSTTLGQIKLTGDAAAVQALQTKMAGDLSGAMKTAEALTAGHAQPGKAVSGLADALTPPGKAIPGPIDALTHPAKAAPGLADALTQPGKAIPGLIDGLTHPAKTAPGSADALTQPGKAIPGLIDGLTHPAKAAPGLADALAPPGKGIPGLIDGLTQPAKAVPNLADALTQPSKAVLGLIDGPVPPTKAVSGLADALTPHGKAFPGPIDALTHPAKAAAGLAEGLTQPAKAAPGLVGSLDHPTKIIPGLADGLTQPGKAVPHLAEGLVQPGKAEPIADASSHQLAKAAPSILADVPAEPSKTLPHSAHETAIASSKAPVRQEADAHPQPHKAAPQADATESAQSSKALPALGDPVVEHPKESTHAGAADPQPGKPAPQADATESAPPPKALPALGDPVVEHPKESTHAGAADPQPGKPAPQNADVPPAAHADQDLAPGAVAGGGGKAEPGFAHTDPPLHFSDLWQQAGGKSEPAQTHTFVPDKAALGPTGGTLVLDVQPPVADVTPNRAAPVKQDARPPGGATDHDVPALVAPSGKVGAWDEALAPFAAKGPEKDAGPHAADLPHGPDDAHGGIGSGLHGNGGSSLTHDLALL